MPGAMVATGLVPLPTSKLKAVKLASPVPPLATGKTPVTLVVRSMVLLTMSALEIKPLNKEPAAERTTPVPKEAIVVEPLAATIKKEDPLEEATLNGFNVPVPWTLKETVDEEALTPATVPLSINIPVPKVLAPVHLVTKPLLPEPVSIDAPKRVAELPAGPRSLRENRPHHCFPKEQDQREPANHSESGLRTLRTPTVLPRIPPGRGKSSALRLPTQRKANHDQSK